MGRKVEVEQFGAPTDAAKAAGRAAFEAGKNIDDNPHAIATAPWSRKAWGDGFVSAKRNAAGILN